MEKQPIFFKQIEPKELNQARALLRATITEFGNTAPSPAITTRTGEIITP